MDMEKVIKALNVEEVRLLRNENDRLRAEVEKLRRVRDAADAVQHVTLHFTDEEYLMKNLQAALDAAKDVEVDDGTREKSKA